MPTHLDGRCSTLTAIVAVSRRVAIRALWARVEKWEQLTDSLAAILTKSVVEIEGGRHFEHGTFL
jgi:hypothetical protein